MDMIRGQTEDAALLRLVAEGDDDAFMELYARYERLAYALTLRVIGDRQLAEDAFAEALLTVWRSASRFDGTRGSVRTWILTIVHRRAVDVVRRENRERVRARVEPPVGNAAAADETAGQREERVRVQEALRRLPDRERELIELAYYAGYTQSDLATALDLSLGTVKSRMFAGLARLRELLTETGERGEQQASLRHVLRAA